MTVPVRVVVALLLVGISWALITPPSGAPDEDSHYVRMVGLGEGQLTGTPVPVGALPADYPMLRPGYPVERVNRESGMYRIPGRAAPVEPCNRFVPAKPFDCPAPPARTGTITARSYHARVLPTSYVLPAVVSRLGSTTTAKVYLGRLAFLLQAALFMLVTAEALGPVIGRFWPGVALLVLRATPLATFLAGTISPSGTEIAAQVACAAALLRWLWGGDRRWLWLSAGTAGVATMTRDLGYLVVPAIVVLAVVAQPDRRAAVRRITARASWPLPVAVAAGSAASLAWRLAVQPRVRFAALSARVVKISLRDDVSMVTDSVGRLGWLDVRLARRWGLLWLALAGVVLVAGCWRRRRAVVQTVVAALAWMAMNVLLLLAIRPTGFTVQARFSFGLGVAGLVTVAAAAARHAPRAPSHRSRHWVVAAALVVATVHAAAFWTMARRHAVGTRGSWWLTGARWSPPLGWPVTATVAAAACVSIVALAIDRGVEVTDPGAGPDGRARPAPR